MDNGTRPAGKLLWRPDDFTPDRPPRRVSWLELFHDLVYVVAVSRLTHGLLHTHGATDFLLFTLLFGLVLLARCSPSARWLSGNAALLALPFAFLVSVYLPLLPVLGFAAVVSLAPVLLRARRRGRTRPLAIFAFSARPGGRAVISSLT